MCSILDSLLREGAITPEQVTDARHKQLGAKRPVHDLLVEMGFISEEAMTATASRALQMPVADLRGESVDPSALENIPYDTAKRHGVFPLRKDPDGIVLAMSNPQDLVAIDDIAILSGRSVRPLLARKSEIAEHIEKYYQLSDALYDLLKNAVAANKGLEGPDVSLASGGSSPAVKLVNLLLADAIRSRASDLHIEPQEDFVEVRYRVDGRLRSIMKIPAGLQASIAARIKVICEMDIAEHRKPQDGRTQVAVNGNPIDLRVSTIPTFYGEKVVLRLLDKKRTAPELETVVPEAALRGKLLAAASAQQGLALVTGPTGSGKTTTLYALLRAIQDETKNIVTIEDPVEYLIGGINQTQVNLSKDVTFATGLRSLLRQDPNVILIGEIRDLETAQAAFQASQTGHMVFSTLHTKGTVATITRLTDLGIPPYLIASSLSIIAAQRLLRKICPHCREEYEAGPGIRASVEAHTGARLPKKLYRGKGCMECDFTGFLGRFAAVETLPLSEELKAAIARGEDEGKLLKAAKAAGMRTLAEQAFQAVTDGVTTLDEAAELMEALPQAAPVPDLEPKAPRAPRILAVDDEADILTLLSARLRQAGYEVLKARNGQEAVEMAVREDPDLMVMDVMMPEMDGFEATRVLRSRLKTVGIPILLLTAMQGKEGELAGLDAGADDYLNKPFDTDKLLARIRMLLRRRRPDTGNGG